MVAKRGVVQGVFGNEPLLFQLRQPENGLADCFQAAFAVGLQTACATELHTLRLILF